MLNSLMYAYQFDVVQAKNKEKVKRLVATIETKRNMKKETVPAKVVEKVLKMMEEDKYFDQKPEPKK